MYDLKLFLFGAPRLVLDEQRIDLRLRKSIALLVYLALTRRSHSREFLASMLWPESDNSKALGNLRRTLYRVNHAVGEELLASTRDLLNFNEQVDVWLDVNAFRRHAEMGLDVPESGEKERAERLFHLKEAAELYTDDFLSGFTLPDAPDFDEWQFFQAENLQHKFKNVLKWLVTIHREHGEWEGGIHYARRWVSLNPLDEAAQRSLMELYAFSDQRVAALRQYEGCQRQLKEELGIHPEESTTALCAAIRRGEITPGHGTEFHDLLAGANRSMVNQVSTQDAHLYEFEVKPTLDDIAGKSDTGNKSQRPAGDLYRPVPVHNLPARPYPFIGRKQELGEIKDLLVGDHERRLLTLTGPGGIGKTFLALEVASEALRAFPNGVYLVSLVSLTCSDQIAPAIAGSIGLHSYEGGEGGKPLFSFLRDKRMLLVLDNYDYLLPDTDLISRLLREAPQVKLLVTSRERLNLRGETVFALEGLPYPKVDERANPRAYSAVQLLVQTAQMIRPQMCIGAEDLHHAGRISRLVQGVPLALLLAASWIDVLSFEEIADEISNSLDFLEGQMGDLPERQLSMRATFAYSWERLPEADREAFLRLSVFRGSFTRQAASHVTGCDVRTLRSLVNKSLITMREGTRYDFHELLRQFGEEQLERSGRADQFRDAHSEYYLQVLGRMSDSLKGSRQRQALREIEADFRNIRAAWKWAVKWENKDVLGDAIEALFLYSDIRWRQREGADLFDSFRAALAPLPGIKASLEYGRVLMKLGMLQSRIIRGDPSIGEVIRRGLEIARKYDSQPDIAFGLLALGHFAADVLRDIPAALDYFQESLEQYTELRDDYYKARAIHLIGHCRLCLTGIKDFVPYAQESLRLTRRIGDKANEAIFLAGLVLADFFLEPPTVSERHVKEAYLAANEIGYGMAHAQANNFAGIFKMLQGNLDAAKQYLDTGLAVAREIGFFIPILYALAAQGMLSSLRGGLEEGIQCIRESSTYEADPYTTQFVAWASAVVYASSGDYPSASMYIERILSAKRQHSVSNIRVHALPVIALLLARDGYREGAVEVLALAKNHPLSYPGWMADWKPIVEMQAQLQTQLGSDVFQSAWRRGKNLDVYRVMDYFNALTRRPEAQDARARDAQRL